MPDFALRLTREEIVALATEYQANKDEMRREKAAFDAGDRIAHNDFDHADPRTIIRPIVRWKSPRPWAQITNNGSAEIDEALCCAVSMRSDHLKLAVLVGLRRVAVPMASAILTAIDRTRFTVIDVRALNTLGVSMLSPTIENYLAYRDFCRRKTRELEVSLRDLDRALWQH